MPALSIATSVPVPIAMPTVAAASAGASLMPSPAIATTRPCDSRRRTRSRLSVGQHFRVDIARGMPSAFATASAVARLSPVIMMTWMPSCRSAASASRVVVLIGSAIANSPAACRRSPTNTIVCPSRERSSVGVEQRDVDAAVVQERPRAGEHDVALDFAR